MSVLDRRLYEVLANAVLVNHEYLENVPVEAAVLYAKHYWATAPPGAGTEVADDAKGGPPLRPVSRSSPRGWPSASIMMMLWGVSELLLGLLKRSKSNAVSRDRHSLKLIWLVTLTAIALGIVAAYRLPACRIPSLAIGHEIGYALVLPGLFLRWYSIIYLGRFFTTNVAIATDHRVIDSGPYQFIRHPSYAGSLLAVLGFSLGMHNWASLLIIFVPICAVTMWRIHIEEQALTAALGQAYRDYASRTKRLVPLIY
jgi:protein-S-isoprenylcysteine O-methyltransferase Ste14